MPPVVFEPTISAGERPKTYALDGAATWTGHSLLSTHLKFRRSSVWATNKDVSENII
jgi:hypothetical protein